MTSIVGVHKIGNYCYLAASGSVEAATDAISEEWTGAPGKVGFGLPPSDRPRSRVAYYAHLLHRGTSQGRDDVAFLDEHEQELFIDWVYQLVCVPNGSSTRSAGPGCGRYGCTSPG